MEPYTRNGGIIGKTMDFASTETYGIGYNDTIAAVSGGAPDFRWTLNNTTAEAGAHSTTVLGTFSYTTGLISNITDQSADMSGSEYLGIGGSPLINTGTGYSWTKRSVSFWFNADTTGSGTYPCIWEEGGGVNWMSIYLDNGLIYANIGENSSTGGHATASVSTGTTYHCLVTFDLTLGSNNIKIYLNGSLAGQATSSVGTDLADHGGNVLLGAGSARNHLSNNINYAVYDGRLQDLCYWYEDALTSTDANDIYVAGSIANNKKNSGIWDLQAVYESIENVPAVVFSGEYITSTNQAGSFTSVTFSNMSIGVADPNRTVAVTVSWNAQGLDRLITSATIGGVSATIIQTTAAAGWERSAIIYADVPIGTTADISINFNSTVGIGAAIGVFRLLNVSNVSAGVFDAHNNTTTTYSTSVSTPVGNSYIISAFGTGNGVANWSNITERYSYTNSNEYLEGASIDSTTSGTVNVSVTGSSYGILTTAVFS